MRTKFLCFMFIVSCALMSGCEDKTSEVVGSWKTQEEIYHGTYSKVDTIILSSDAISFNGGKNIPIELKYEKESGDILVLRKKDGGTIHAITIMDKEHIKLTKGFNGNYVYVRTTPEDVDAIVKGPGTVEKGKNWLDYRSPSSTDKP